MQSHWIFSLDQRLRPEYRKAFANALETALDAWQAHGKTVAYEVHIEHDQFVFVQALSGASGCAIDWMKQSIENVASRFEGELVDAAEVFYETQDGIKHMHFTNVEAAIADGHLAPETVVFDQTVVNHNSFDNWRKPLSASWLSRFLPQPAGV